MKHSPSMCEALDLIPSIETKQCPHHKLTANRQSLYMTSADRFWKLSEESSMKTVVINHGFLRCSSSDWLNLAILVFICYLMYHHTWLIPLANAVQKKLVEFTSLAEAN